MRETDWDLYLAGLVHDIGKLGQRAFGPNQGLSDQSRRMMDILCPVAGDRSGGTYSSHLHVLYTNEFLNLVESTIPECFNLSRVVELAAYHHRPSSAEQNLLADADRLASAVERTGQAGPEAPVSSTAFRRQRLYPLAAEVFSQPGGEDRLPPAGHRIEPWERNSDVLFPLDKMTGELRDEYHALWEQLVESWRRNRVRDPWLYIARALSDLERYTWCVPAATNVFPDISLYDHSRAVAAVAACLDRAEDVELPFILVTGDFGGIQRYIFDLPHRSEDEEEEGSSKGFTKLIRARSFNVRLFTEQVVFQLLRETDLPLAQRILSAGGKLYLLLPNEPRCMDTLERTAESLADWSMRVSDGRLRFNIAWITLSRNDLHEFSKVLQSVNLALADEEKRPLHRTLVKNGGWDVNPFLRPQMHPSNEKDDPDIERGQRLPKSAAIKVIQSTSTEEFFPFADFQLIERGEAVRDPGALVLQWDDLDLDRETANHTARFAFHVPREKGTDNILTFEEIAGEATGRKALGFIKADVDDLGMILSRGLPVEQGEKDRVSISRIATLSRALEGFFGHHVNCLVEERFPHIYLVFSGGDDLVAVGPWDQAIDFISTLRSDLSRYVADNSAWGMSAGVLIAHWHIPMITAVKQAEELLEKSKEQPGKDHLAVLGETLSWPIARQAVEDGKKLYKWLKNGTLRTSQVRRLMIYAGMFNEFHRTGNTEHLRYIYLLINDLKRNWKGDDLRDTADQRESLLWAQRLTNPEFKELPALKLSCTYALFAARSPGEKKEASPG